MSLSILIYVVELILFIGLYIVSYSVNWFYQVSFYGIIMLTYLVVQIITSAKNRRNNLQVVGKQTQSQVVLLIVGHRENHDYWIQCLRSAVNLNPDTSLCAIYIVVDGDEEEDKKMYETARNFFQLHIVPYPVDISIVSKRGKRGVMAYGFSKIRYDMYGTALSFYNVVVTDSDTVLDPNSLLRLNECLESDPRNGCATGSLYIFNRETILTGIIDARYAYAFNVERACASYFGCMSCCSGPLSIYRLEVLDETLLQRFVSQQLCSVKCEPGDDRHLTNLVMAKGYMSRQTQLSVAGTEAPEILFRYILQQLRWNRSFYRELKWQVECIPVQSFMLHFVSIYELTFPLFVMIWCLSLFFMKQSLLLLIRSFVLSLFVLIIRSVLLTYILSKNYIVYGFLYYLLYFTTLLPLKLFSLVTVLNNSWVTPSRHQRFQCLPSCSWDAQLALILIFLWNVVVVISLGRLILNHNDVMDTHGFLSL